MDPIPRGAAEVVLKIWPAVLPLPAAPDTQRRCGCRTPHREGRTSRTSPSLPLCLHLCVAKTKRFGCDPALRPAAALAGACTTCPLLVLLMEEEEEEEALCAMGTFLGPRGTMLLPLQNTHACTTSQTPAAEQSLETFPCCKPGWMRKAGLFPRCPAAS